MLTNMLLQMMSRGSMMRGATSCRHTLRPGLIALMTQALQILLMSVVHARRNGALIDAYQIRVEAILIYALTRRNPHGICLLLLKKQALLLFLVTFDGHLTSTESLMLDPGLLLLGLPVRLLVSRWRQLSVK